MREIHVKNELRQVPVEVTSYTCDGCGKSIDPDVWIGDNVGHELVIILDPDECVSFYRRRDLCDECLTPIWEAVNKLIKADSWVERDREYDDLLSLRFRMRYHVRDHSPGTFRGVRETVSHR